ncbi:MAG: polymerase [Cryptosporangiaceae bacterium]|nr:polymerase [Cryptosporangiaceae bacterium]
MRIAVVGTWGGGALLRSLADDGSPSGPAEQVPDLVAAVREREARESPRWVWASTSEVYPGLLGAGVRVARCHDLALVEALLLGHDGRWGEPRSVAAAWARLRGEPVPADPQHGPRDLQPALFEPDRTGLPGDVDPLDAVVAVHRRQQQGLSGPLALLAAAESAGALLAAELGHDGLPWRADVHDELLTGLLGPREEPGVRPARLRELAARIAEAFGGRAVNPDAPADIVRAFAREGVQVPSARSWVLRKVEHPAAPLILAYKELSRLHAAHGWAWLDQWVSGGRFRPEYVPGGVVSGRWATRGGGALQIPRVVRRAVVADPGWALVVADASQLEPRVLAALAGDHRMAAAAAGGDLYQALADEAFGGDRARAKVAMLGTIYGQTAGEAAQLLVQLRQRFPAAVRYVEAAATAGEEGRLVRSVLGRTCPPPSAAWRELLSGGPADVDGGGAVPDPDGAPTGDGRRAARDRGRFTRNFVVQASAADWALALLAVLRARLAELGSPGDRPALVFFQHDEVIVHTPEPLAAAVADAVTSAGREATRMVFGPTPVQFPLGTAVVACYADAK